MRSSTRAIIQLRASEAGNSTIEYALIIAMISAVVLLVAETGSSSVVGVFSRLGDRDAVALKSPASVTVEQGPNGNSVTGNDSAVAAGRSSWLVLITALAAVASSIGLVAYRRKPKAEEPEAEQETPAQPTIVDRLIDKRQRMLRFMSANTNFVFGSQLAVKHMMTLQLESVSPDTNIEELQELTKEKGIRHVLVTGKDRKLLGIISDRDLMSREGRVARDIMTDKILSVTPDTPVCMALTLLFRHRISCLPIVEEQRLCGILTTTDAILALQCLLQTLERAGTLTKSMLDDEIQLEGTLQVLMRGFHGSNSEQDATPSEPQSPDLSAPALSA